MKLKRSERVSLIVEGFITSGMIILLYVASFEIMFLLIANNPGWIEGIWLFGDMVISVQNQQLVGLTPVFLLFLFIIGGIAVFWRLKRRHRQYELSHIIEELHYIADQKEYSHRISGDYTDDLQRVVDSIHRLVDSTVEAMEEERHIENSKDELITNVSHDIRTPLTSIIGYLGLINESRYETKEELENYAQRAFVKSKQMKVLVDDLFEYTKVRQTTTPLNIIEFDMIQLLEQLSIDFEIEAEKHDMNIGVETQDDQIVMKGDTEKIVRLFNNLISNALKYGEGGDQVVVEVDKTGDSVVILVKNNGKTMSDEELNQIFERFYRAEVSRSQEISGTGLGLAICKGIVDLHQGDITAKSEDGWTIFEVTLPLEVEEQSNKE